MIPRRWEAHVQAALDGTRSLALFATAPSGPGEYEALVAIGETSEVRTLKEAEQWPWMRLPRELAEPLRDALDEYLGKPRDDYKARYDEALIALDLERRRVDTILESRLRP